MSTGPTQEVINPSPVVDTKGGQKTVGNKRPNNEKFKGGKKLRSNDWKTPVTALVACYAIRSHFPVFLGTEGFPQFVKHVYDGMIAHDHHIELPYNTLLYISVLALYNRINWVVRLTGTGIIEQASRLSAFVGNVHLPRVIVKYINSIGVVALPNSALTVPIGFSPHEQIDVYGMFTIQELAGLLDVEYDVAHDPWLILPDLQGEYNRLVARIPRHAKLEMVTKDVEGTPASLVSYTTQADGTLRPMSPAPVDREEAQYGAACRFRNFGQYAAWPGEWKHLLLPCFSTDFIEPRSFIAKLTLNDLSA